VSIFQPATVGGTLVVRSTRINDTGTFEFAGVAPGAYELAATMNAPGPTVTTVMIMGGPLGAAAGIPPAGPVRPNPAEPIMAGRSQIDVASTDISNVSIVLQPGFNVNGRVSIDGRAAGNIDPAMASIRVQLQSQPQIPALSVAPAGIDDAGAFAIDGVSPAHYRLSVMGLPRNTYVKSARLAGTDILNGGLRIESEPRAGLEIVLGTSPGSLEVLVTDDRAMPAAGVTVAIAPDLAQQKRYDLYRSATSDSSGRIRLEGLVPGDYKVYAWEDVENGAWTDPDFMRAYENRGVSVRVGEGGQAAAEVRVIPYRGN
jgi:hypothetical protein